MSFRAQREISNKTAASGHLCSLVGDPKALVDALFPAEVLGDRPAGDIFDAIGLQFGFVEFETSEIGRE